MKRSPIKVYLAGPIAKNCWRHRLVPGLREAFSDDEDVRELARHDVATELPTISPGFVCVGPWFASCDHGCMHGWGTHGADVGGDEARSNVFRASIKRIGRADAVFAYFNREQAYGSVFELAEASARGKPIFIGFAPDMLRLRDDMWFPAQAGLGSRTGHVGTVDALWAEFCQRLSVGLQGRLISKKTCPIAARRSYDQKKRS